MMSASEREQSRRADMSVVWHDLECGAYEADLALWERLAESNQGPVLDLGCGTGRVALHLARRGHRVVGVDSDADLVAAFNRRAAGLPAEAIAADARDFQLDEEFGLVLAPTQLAQLFDDPKERVRCLSCVARHLRPGGIAAFAIVERVPAATDDIPPPLPDTREVDGWVYSSQPLEIAIDEEKLLVRRLRQLVSPTGDLSDEVDEIPLFALSADRLEDEAEDAGLRPSARDEVPMTDDHVGSTVVVIERRS
jgi:SAM-dependent methyltransferase